MPNILKKKDVCSTIQANCKYYPTSLQNVTLTTTGDFQSSVVDRMNAVVWMDEKSVHFVNTYYEFDEVISVKEKAI